MKAPILNRNLIRYYDPLSCKIEWRDPLDFIRPERLDIFVKYLYARAILTGQDVAFYQELYLASIDAFGHFVEKDKDNKIGKDAFIDTMHKLISSLKTDGYKEELVIPYDENGIAMDGAHRIAVAAALGIRVSAVLLYGIMNPIYNGIFFRDRLMNNKYLDAITREYALWNKRCALVYEQTSKTLSSSIDNLVNWKFTKIGSTYFRVSLVEFPANMLDSYSTHEVSINNIGNIFDGTPDCLCFLDKIRQLFTKRFYIVRLKRAGILCYSWYVRFVKSITR